MGKALAFKELRECLGVSAIALAVAFYLVARHTGWDANLVSALLEQVVQLSGLQLYRASPDESPFVNAGLPGQLGLVFGLYAIALGFRQTVGESLHGAWPLLLRLPISRQRMLHVKLCSGLAVYLACAAVPILLYSLWAATPGTHASPFYWSMTVPTWIAWLSMSCLYLAAFLSGLRTARWFGSRLAPVVAALVPVMVVQQARWSWWWSCVMVVFTSALLVITIQTVAEDRDFS